MRADTLWAESAACAGADPEIFFGSDADSLDRAREMCAGCRVIAECFAASLIRRETHGVWAGFTEYQRRQIRRVLTGDGSALTLERARQWITRPDRPAPPDEPRPRRRGRPRRSSGGRAPSGSAPQ